MKIIAILFLVYFFLKSIYYGIFEIKENENKFGGVIVILLAILGLIFPLSLLISYY